MKQVIFLLFSVCTNNFLFAQQLNNQNTDKEEQEDTIISLLILDETQENIVVKIFPQYPDSFYAEKIASIPSEIPLTYNQEVKRIINFYTNKKRDQVERMIGLENFYFPMFQEIFARYNIPSSMRYLAVIESALNPFAVSKAGATGMWQFMYGTGKRYELGVNSFIDERKDPYKATEAAARHLRDLYDMFGDWLLALAAYNCGAKNVERAIARSSGSADYWELKKYLPKETRGYVPAFIAAAYVMNFYEYHELTPQAPVICYDSVCTVLIERPAHFHSLSKHLEMSVDELMHLNPELKRGFVPQEVTPYWLKLPEDKTLLFEQYQDTIFFESEKIYSAQFPQFLFGNDLKDKVELIYTVKKGDHISSIADWYDCTIQNIRLWNDIYKGKIAVGQKLSIFVPQEKAKKYQKINMLTSVQKQKIKSHTSVASKLSPSSFIVDEKFIYHTVKSGDSLWTIAKSYPGITVDHLKKINNLDNASKIKPGMKIKIQPAG